MNYAPKGQIADFKIKKKDFDLSEVEFVTKDIGTYRIDFEENNIKINNSPCFINVYDPSLAVIESKPENLVVSANNYIKGNSTPNKRDFTKILKFNYFKVNLGEANEDKFKAWAQCPNGLTIPLPILKNLGDKVKIVPNEKGKYLIHMKLGDQDLNGY